MQTILQTRTILYADVSIFQRELDWLLKRSNLVISFRKSPLTRALWFPCLRLLPGDVSESISSRYFTAHKNAERVNFTRTRRERERERERGCRTRNIIRLQIFQANNTRPALAERLLESGTANNIISCLKSSVVRGARLYCGDETFYKRDLASNAR